MQPKKNVASEGIAVLHVTGHAGHAISCYAPPRKTDEPLTPMLGLAKNSALALRKY